MNVTVWVMVSHQSFWCLTACLSLSRSVASLNPAVDLASFRIRKMARSCSSGVSHPAKISGDEACNSAFSEEEEPSNVVLLDVDEAKALKYTAKRYGP